MFATKLLKKIKNIDKAIKEKKKELSQTENPLNGYYLKIATEAIRKRDIIEIKSELKSLLSHKFSLIESLETEAYIEKVKISNTERNLIIND